MKKTTKILTLSAALTAAALSMSACGLYGPPPDDYSPEYNENITEYGPPEDYDENHYENEITTEMSSDDDDNNNEEESSDNISSDNEE